jgi:peptide/nickel transport system ATP-binding protein
VISRANEGTPLVQVHGLRIWSGSERRRRTITHGTELAVWPGETVGIVGESGSGKSLTARALIRLLPEGVFAEGSIRYRGRELMNLPEKQMRRLRGGDISVMFQDPFTMLNPLLRCGEHIGEMLIDGDGAHSRDWVRDETVRRLAEVGIHDPLVAGRYPFQLSGGMRQRIALAAALAKDPELLIADEPSTALDVTTQAEILKLLRSVQQGRGMGLILITHDLRVAFTTCDRVYVLYAGSLLEVGGAETLEDEPLHPYTLGLLLSEPSVHQRLPELAAIPGAVPAPDDVADRCPFCPRCRWAQDVCRAGAPPLIAVEPERLSACVRIGEIRAEMRDLRDRVLSIVVDGEPVEGRPLAAAEDVVKTFDVGRRRHVDALKGVSLTIGAGECVGLVGESGSGKTTLGRCFVGLETPTSGRVEIDGVDASDYAALSRETRAGLRHTVQMIFQDPYSTLNPRHTVGRMLVEALQQTGMSGRRGSADAAVAELLDRVGLPPAFSRRRPAALSGGERQRVAIARALAVQPRLLICDEPVSALDVSVQAQILNLFRNLQRDLQIGYLFITHDLAVVRQVADRIYVLFKGDVVESGPADEILSHPRHSYTRQLMASVPGATTRIS